MKNKYLIMIMALLTAGVYYPAYAEGESCANPIPLTNPRGEIVIRDMSFGYDANRPILKKINLHATKAWDYDYKYKTMWIGKLMTGVDFESPGGPEHVFYEDNDILVYYLRQNPRNLYELATMDPTFMLPPESYSNPIWPENYSDAMQ